MADTNMIDYILFIDISIFDFNIKIVHTVRNGDDFIGYFVFFFAIFRRINFPRRPDAYAERAAKIKIAVITEFIRRKVKSVDFKKSPSR